MTRGRSSTSRRRAIVAACAALALTAAVSCGAPEPRSAPAPAAPTADASFVSLAPDVHEPCGMTGSAEAIWVLSCSGKIVRIPADGGVSKVVDVDGEPVGLDGVGTGPGGSVWALVAKGSEADREGSVNMIGAGTGEARAEITLGSSIPVNAVAGGDRLWVVTADGGLYSAEGSAATRIDSSPTQIWALASADTLYTVSESGDVAERALASGAAGRTHRAVLPNAIAAALGVGSLWLADGGRVVRLGLSSGRVANVALQGTVNDIEPCGGRVWLSQPDYGLRAVDGRGKLVRALPLRVAPRYLTCVDSRLWILTEEGSLGSVDASA